MKSSSDLLREGIARLGYEFLVDSPSNQIFPIFPDAIADQLDKKYVSELSQDMEDGRRCIRLVTRWATDLDQCHQFVADLASLTH